MSSTLQTKPSGDGGRQYVGFEEYIEYQLKLARRGIRGADLLTGGVGAVLLTVGYLFLFVVTDHWVISGGWSQTSRYVLWVGFLGVLGAWFWYRLIRPWSQKVTSLYAASQLEHSHPELKSNLLTLVDLQQAGRPVSPVIIEAMERRAALNLQQVNVDDAVDRHTLTKLSYALLAMVVVLCVYTLASPKSLMSSAWRALFPMAQVTLSTRTTILEVKPGEITVLAHATPDIEATLSGTIPGEVRVLYTTADRRMVDEAFQLQDTGEGIHRFRGRLLGETGHGLMQNLTYRIEAGDAVSPTYSITVRQPPTATVNEVAYDYPKYMGLDDRTQSDSAIDAWEGTTVTVRATTNVPVDRATVLFSDSEDTTLKAEELPMQIQEGVNLSAQWQLRFRADGTFPRFYRIQLLKKSPTGDELVAVPTLHTQRIRADLPPKLEILHPTADVELPANGSLPVAFEASDPDFLLKSVVMKFEKDGEALTKQDLLFDAPPFEPKTRGQHLLKVDQFAVEPGKTLTFWLEARDNFEPFADRLPNISRTPKITITIINPVTPEEATQELADHQELADQKIEAAELNSNPAGETNSEPQPQDAAPPEQPSPEQQSDEATEPMEDNATGAEQEPLSTEGNEAEATDPQELSETGDPQPNPPDQPKNDQPKPNKAPKGQPQPKPTQNGPPQSGQSSEGQPQPSATPDGQPPSKPSPQRKPKTGTQPAGTEQDGLPPTDGSQAEPTANEKPPSGTPPKSIQPQPRKDKASPDEALAKLIERQQQRDQKASEAPSLAPPKPDQPRNDEPSTGKPDPSDPAVGEKSVGGTHQPKPGEGEKPSKPPMKNGKTPEPKGSPMPSEATEPSPAEEASNPTDPMTTEKTTPPSPGKKPTPGSKPKTGSESGEPQPGEKVGEEEKTNDGTPDENGTRPDPAAPMKNGDKPPVGATPPKAAGEETLMPVEAEMPPGAAESVKPQTNPSQGKPATNPPTKKEDTPPGSPKQKPGDPSAEPPMPDETGEAMPDSPMPDSPMPGQGAEEPGAEPAAKPPAPDDAPPKGAEGPGEMPKTDPPMGEDPMAKDPTQPGKKPDPMPGDKPEPEPGDQPMPGVQQPDKQKPTDKQKQAPADGSKPKEKSTPKSSDQSSPMSPSGLGEPSESSPEGDSGMAGETPPGEKSPSEGGTPNGEGADSKGTPSAEGSPSGDPAKGGSKGGGKPAEGAPGEPASGEAAAPSDPAEPGESNGSPSSEEKSTNSKPKGKPKSPQTPKEPGPDAPGEKAPMPDADGSGEPEEGSEGGPPGGGGGGDQPKESEEGTAPEAQPGDAKPAPKSAPGKPPKQGGPKKPSDKPGQPAQDQGGDKGGGGGGAPGGGPSDPSGPPGGQASDGNSAPGPGAVNGGLQGGSNPEDTHPTEASAPLNSPEEAVNLENRKKAANLALKRLQEELSRGEKPQELMDELGFDEADLDSFLKMMDQNLNKNADESSPEALARRRQFDELLNNVELETPGELKSGGTQPREASQSSGSTRRATPKKYESSEEAYRKQLQKGK